MFIATLIILIFALLSIYLVLGYSYEELSTGDRVSSDSTPVLDASFRKIEKYVLYSLKHILQGIVLFTVKYWYITTAKTKKFLMEKWPKIHDKFLTKKEVMDKPISNTKIFLKRAVAESKFKIKRIKDKVKAQHGVEEESGLESVSPKID